MAGSVKQSMIERTAVLLAKKGLQGASFSEILEASGAPRGSLYHHFPGGKDELVLAALEHAGNQAMGALDRLSGKPAREIAEGFLSLWRSVLARSDFSAGCAVVAVTVADNGSGIAANKLDAIFEPFFTTKDVGKGTGLGLSQALGFAKQSGGEIKVTSVLGQGSTFTITLPAADV